MQNNKIPEKSKSYAESTKEEKKDRISKILKSKKIKDRDKRFLKQWYKEESNRLKSLNIES